MLLEKDFWVCWLLGLLFGSEFAGSLVFKGATSFSNVFGVIERFSEDIEMTPCGFPARCRRHRASDRGHSLPSPTYFGSFADLPVPDLSGSSFPGSFAPSSRGRASRYFRAAAM